jgi:stage IV sporulation protein FB
LLILVYGAVIFGAGSNGLLSGALYGMFVILLLFVCVTLHEFGHALVAQYYGINVPTITLLPIGGVASLERLPDKPSQELVIAIAGPLVNLALAAVLLPLTFLAAGVQMQNGVPADFGAIFGNVRTPGVTNLLGYLAIVNIMLALFNLLPAFPMDGGRILRALLAMAMPYVRATWIAVLVGRLMAVIFAIIGIFGTNLFMLLIAFFVYVGGNGEMENVRTRRALQNIPLRAALRVGGLRLYTSELLGRAADLLPASYETAFPVMDLSGTLAGVLTRERLIQGLRDAGPLGRVVDYMIPAADIPVCSVDEQLMEVWDRMATSGSQVVAVQDAHQRFLGLISATDLGEVIRAAGDPTKADPRRATVNGSAEIVTPAQPLPPEGKPDARV